MPAFEALVLVCSLVLTPDMDQCTASNAMQVARIEQRFATAAACKNDAERLAPSVLPRPLIPGEDRIKIVCTNR